MTQAYKCPNCGLKITLAELKSDPELWEDVRADGIYVCECCEEIELSKIKKGNCK
jgi:hypothetical protein